jgi:hypothetical protein
MDLKQMEVPLDHEPEFSDPFIELPGRAAIRMRYRRLNINWR